MSREWVQEGPGRPLPLPHPSSLLPGGPSRCLLFGVGLLGGGRESSLTGAFQDLAFPVGASSEMLRLPEATVEG